MNEDRLAEAITQQADFICNLKYEDLEQNVKERAKLILLDSIACMAVGNRQYRENNREKGNYCLVGEAPGEKATTIFLNGSAMVKNELDEGNQFAFGHPACHIVPAFLAECQDTDPDGSEAITALAAAYEVSCRWGSSAYTKAAMHVHGTMQTVGAAAVSCKLNHCTREETERAMILANSLPQATTWNSAFHGDQLRNAYIGLANEVGSNAFRMVRTGIESSIESLASVWTEVLDGDIDTEGLTRNLGQDYFITKNYFKVHSACRYTHSFVDMVQKFVSEGLQPEKIGRIEIETYHAAAKLNGQEARNSFAAKFSIPAALAICLIYGELSVESLTDQHLQNPKVKDLAKKIFVCENQEFNELLPEIRRNKIRILQNDGREFEKDMTVTKGDYLDPFSKEEVTEKFRILTKGIWSSERQDAIIKYVEQLEEKESIRDFFEMLGQEIYEEEGLCWKSKTCM